MAKTSGEIEREFIEGLQSATGKDLQAWLEAIDESGLSARNDIVRRLKSSHNFGHMHATLLAGIHANGGKTVYGSETDLLNGQFRNMESIRPLFERLRQAVLERDGQAEFVAKKTYVSIAKKREFAAVNIRKGELRLGLDLGDMPVGGRLEKSRLTGPMPRISRMLVIRSESDIDEELFSLLALADARINS